MTVTRSTEKIFEDNEGNFANNDLINLSIFLNVSVVAVLLM